MYGLQLDHLAAVLGVGEARARSVAARWRGQRYAESARLGPGGPWTWVTRAGLATCGLPYTAGPPALGRLAHIRAVTAVRLALEAAPAYAADGGCGPEWAAGSGYASTSPTARCTGRTAPRCRGPGSAGPSRPS